VQREDSVLMSCDGRGTTSMGCGIEAKSDGGGTTSMGCGIEAKIDAWQGVAGVGDGDDEMPSEERDNAVLLLLSPRRQTSSRVCLTGWSVTRPCTVPTGEKNSVHPGYKAQCLYPHMF
jgi:hypothetical protein